MISTTHWYNVPSVGCAVCEDGGNPGYVEHLHDDILPISKECVCLRKHIEKKKTKELVERTIFTKKMWEDSTKENCISFVKDYNSYIKPKLLDAIRTSESLYICGKVNAGKTLLSMFLARKYMEAGVGVLYYPFSEAILELRVSKDGDFMKNLIDVPVLVLDDLGTSMGNMYNDELAQNIINSRYLRQKITIITSNLLLGEVTDSDNFNRLLSKIQRSYTVITL